MVPKNNLSIKVGFIKGKALINTAHLSDCRGVNCPIVEKCPYRKNGKCQYEKDYMESYFYPLVDPVEGIGDRLTRRQLDILGRKALPIYRRLFKLGVDIMAIDDMTTKGGFVSAYRDDKNRWHMYPQFKAQDEALRSLKLIEDDLGLNEIWEKKFGGSKTMPSADGGIDTEGMFLNGMEGAYEEMANAESSHQEEKPEEECPADYLEEENTEYNMLYDHGINTKPIYTEED